MQISDINRVVEQVSRDKGIDREVLIRALEEALKSAARKKFGNKMDIEVQYNNDTGEIEVFQFKDVAEEVTEPALEISLEEGRKLDPECEIGDSLGIKMDTSTFGRIAAQSAKQVIIQKLKDAERDAIYNNFMGRRGEVINGIIQRIDHGNIIVNLGQTEGVVPAKEQVPRETYHRGDRILQEVARLLKENVRTFDFVVRFGGDEFLIVLLEPGFGTEAVIERIRVSLSKSEKIRRLLEFPLTLSIGGAAWMPESEESLDDVLARADQNMYQDKKSKNGSPGM